MARRNDDQISRQLRSTEEELEQFCKRHFRLPSDPFSLEVPIEKIREKSGCVKDPLITCKACVDPNTRRFNPKKSEFVIASDKWSRLGSSLGAGGNINLLDPMHISRLIPQRNRRIHLVTFQNGIQHTFEDFQEMGEVIWEQMTEHFSEMPLCIGFYNPTTNSPFTDAMRAAIDETNRRRIIQNAYNEKHGIEPISIVKAVRDITDQFSAHAVGESKAEYRVDGASTLPKKELEHMIKVLEENMKAAAKSLEFEKAAMLRDQAFELRSILAEDDSLKPWEKIKILAGEN